MQNQHKNYAWTTLVTKPFYFGGAIFLAKRLKALGSAYPMIVLITDNIDSSKLKIFDKENVQYKIIPYLCFPEPITYNSKAKKYLDTINKFQGFNLLEYDKVMYLDTDIVALNNIDFVFDYLEGPHIIEGFYKIKDEPMIGNYSRDTLMGECFLLTPHKDMLQYIIDNTSEPTLTGWVDELVIYKLFETGSHYFPIELRKNFFHAYAPYGNKLWKIFTDYDWIQCYNKSPSELSRIFEEQNKILLRKV